MPMKNDRSDLPDVLIALERNVEKGFIKFFDLGFNIRDTLRELGWKSYLIDVSDPDIEDVLQEQDAVIICIAEYIRSENENAPSLFRSELDKLGIPYIGSTAAIIATYNNKYNVQKKLSEVGLCTPTSLLLNSDTHKDEITAFILEIGFPFILKPTVGIGGSEDVWFIENKKELKESLFRLLSGVKGEFLLQKYIDGPEFTIWINDDPGIGQPAIFEINTGESPIYSKDLKNSFGTDSEIGVWNEKLRLFGMNLYTDNILEKIRISAQQAHDALGAFGYSRIDIRLDGDDVVILEVNLTPRLYEEARESIGVGVSTSYGEILEQQIYLVLNKKI